MSTCFDRGLLRSRGSVLPFAGQRHVAAGGIVVQFSLDVSDAVIRQAMFNASTCVTLVAYCELLAERITGKTLQEAIRLVPSDLVRDLPEIPAVKWDRAGMCIQALRSAIQSATLVQEPFTRNQGGLR